MGLAHGVALAGLPAQIQRLDLLAQLFFQLVRVRAGRPDWLEIRLVDCLRVRLRKDIPDVARHRLPAVLDPGLLVLGLLRVFQKVVRLLAELALLIPPPVCDLGRRRVIVCLGLVHGKDALRILHALHVLRCDLAAQEAIQDAVVLRRQQVLCRRPLIRPPQALEVCVQALDLLHRRGDGPRLLLPHPRLGIPPCHIQRSQHVLHAGLVVVLCPALEFLRVLAVVFVQRHLYLLDSLRYLEHPHELIRRMRDARRKQLRRHLLHFLVCHIDRQSALVCDAQPPECCPSEIVKVRNVRPVCLRQCDLQIAQPRFYVLVLVVKFRVHLHAAPVGLLKVPVYRLLRDPAGLEIFVHHFLNGRLQDLLPCRKRHRKRLLDGRRRLPAHPAQIVLRLLRNAVHRQTFIHRRRLFCRFLRCQPRVLLRKPALTLCRSLFHRSLLLNGDLRKLALCPHLRNDLPQLFQKIVVGVLTEVFRVRAFHLLCQRLCLADPLINAGDAHDLLRRIFDSGREQLRQHS